MKDIIWGIGKFVYIEFDKLLLMALFMYLSHLHLNTDTIVGALLGIVTGATFKRSLEK